MFCSLVFFYMRLTRNLAETWQLRFKKGLELCFAAFRTGEASTPSAENGQSIKSASLRRIESKGESCWEFVDGNLEILEIYDSWGSFLGGHGDKKLLDDVMWMLFICLLKKTRSDSTIPNWHEETSFGNHVLHCKTHITLLRDVSRIGKSWGFFQNPSHDHLRTTWDRDILLETVWSHTPKKMLNFAGVGDDPCVAAPFPVIESHQDLYVFSRGFLEPAFAIITGTTGKGANPNIKIVERCMFVNEHVFSHQTLSQRSFGH